MTRHHKPALSRLPLVAALQLVLLSCSTPDPSANRDLEFTPSAVIDLGAVVTEDLPERVWGKALLQEFGFTRSNAFDVVTWELPMEGGTVSGSNAYYTLFNHGGPHVDAPSHMGLGGGLDSYPIEAFSGPAKVFDVSGYANGRSIPVDVFQGHVEAGDVVLVYSGYTPPQTDEEHPQVITLTNEAAEFLATTPVRAYGTDSFSVESLDDLRLPSIHHAFLSRGIPIYEELFNVVELLNKGNMFFVGAPVNIKDGDGMIVRPVVFVY